MQTSSRRLHWTRLEDVLTPLWTIRPLTTGTSSGLPSSRLPDRCRRLQDVFIKDFLEDVFTPLRAIKTVIWGGTSSGLPSISLPDRSRRLQDVFIEAFFTTSSQRLPCVCTHMPYMCAKFHLFNLHIVMTTFHFNTIPPELTFAMPINV